VTPPALSLAPAAPPSARSALLALAGAATHQPAPTLHRYRYVHTQNWVWTRQQVTPRPSYTRYEIVTSWTDARGTGRILTVERTEHGFRSDRPSAPPAPGDNDPITSAASLARLVGPGSRLPVAFQLGQLAVLAARRPLAPSAQARLLRRLSADPGIVNAGMTTDRSGRVGVAVSATSGSQRITLVFDQTTGRLLEADNTLVTAANNVDVPAGGLLSYRVYLQSGWVSEIGQAPPAATSSSG
jgi:hypothetical protein